MQAHSQSVNSKTLKPTASAKRPDTVPPDYLAQTREWALKALREQVSHPKYWVRADSDARLITIADGHTGEGAGGDGCTRLRILRVPEEAPDDLFFAIYGPIDSRDNIARVMWNVSFGHPWLCHTETFKPSIEVVA